MKIDRIDHIVLTVVSVEVTIEFYTRVLGMEPITFAGGRRGLAFGVQKINLHSAANPYPEKAKIPTPGSGDFCMITEAPIPDVIDHLKAENVKIEVGPIPKSGATGNLTSIYFRDPDGNLLELSNYVD
jgi:catechol 2,3-dioxygenase-like lactoylglutathione lyase family enzyme